RGDGGGGGEDGGGAGRVVALAAGRGQLRRRRMRLSSPAAACSMSASQGGLQSRASSPARSTLAGAQRAPRCGRLSRGGRAGGKRSRMRLLGPQLGCGLTWPLRLITCLSEHAAAVPQEKRMATKSRTQERIATVDPIWTEVRQEAEAAVRSEPALGGFIYATILSKDRLEEAVCHR